MVNKFPLKAVKLGVGYMPADGLLEPMSILLQSAATSKYVESPTQWTETPDVALQFERGPDALLFCYEYHLRNMRILGRFDDPKKDFTISIEGNVVE